MLRILRRLTMKFDLSLKSQLIVSAIYLSIILVSVSLLLRLGGNILIPYVPVIAKGIIVISYLPLLGDILIIGRWIIKYPQTKAIREENHQKFLEGVRKQEYLMKLAGIEIVDK